jgi:hypothetical protein
LDIADFGQQVLGRVQVPGVELSGDRLQSRVL